MISHPKSRRNEIVGTTNISIAAIPSAWLRRNVLQPWDGGSRRLTMYLATLVCPISTPSLTSSPWIRGAPHSGLAMLISRISLRISNGTVGLPPRAFDFQRQYNRKPERCHLTTVSGLTIASASRTPGQTKIKRSLTILRYQWIIRDPARLLFRPGCTAREPGVGGREMRLGHLAMPILLGVITMTDGSNASPLDEFHWKNRVLVVVSPA